MSFLDSTAFIVRCNKCDTERQSYNDPRTSKSVIECKKCFESHNLWTYVRTIDEKKQDGGETANKDEGAKHTANPLVVPNAAEWENDEEGNASKRREEQTENAFSPPAKAKEDKKEADKKSTAKVADASQPADQNNKVVEADKHSTCCVIC